MGKYRSKRKLLRMQTIAEFMQNLESKSTRQQNQVILILMRTKICFVIERAKTYNVPKHIIDRAIEKAKGSGDEQYSELRYEGFGPNGSMVIVDTLTNNVNPYSSRRTSSFW